MRLCVGESSDGWLVCMGFCECALIRSSTLWLLPCTLLQLHVNAINLRAVCEQDFDSRTLTGNMHAGLATAPGQCIMTSSHLRALLAEDPTRIIHACSACAPLPEMDFRWRSRSTGGLPMPTERAGGRRRNLKKLAAHNMHSTIAQ